MMLRTRPARPGDASPGLPDLLPDRWRDGGNRRSIVALDEDGVLGHCRGIDNVFHPDSRVLILETLPSLASCQRGQVEDALVRAQIAVSDLPLRVKPAADEPDRISLCVRHGGVLVQLMPPWRYEVGPALRRWSDSRRPRDAAPGPRTPSPEDALAMLDLHVAHYRHQHARWSPAAAPAVLRAESAEDFRGGAPGAFDPDRSVVLMRGGHPAAQALVWPAEVDGAREVTLQHRPEAGSTARADLESCLAEVVRISRDGDVLLIDTHVTEDVEVEIARDLPSPPPERAGPWSAIVAIPVPGGPEPVTLPAGRIPSALTAFDALRTA